MPRIDPGDSNGDIIMTNTPKEWYKRTTIPGAVNTANYNLQQRVRSRVPSHVSDYTQADHSLKRFSPPRDEIQFRADRILVSKIVHSDREAIMGISTNATDSKRRALTLAPSREAEARDMPDIPKKLTDTKRHAAGGAPSSEKNAGDIHANQSRQHKQDQRAAGDQLIQRARSLQESWSADKVVLKKLAEQNRTIEKLTQELRRSKGQLSEERKRGVSLERKVRKSNAQLLKEQKRATSPQSKPEQSAGEEPQRPETPPQDGDLLASLQVEVEKIGEPTRHISPQTEVGPRAEEHRRTPSELQKDGDIETHLQVKAAPSAGQQQPKQQNRDISPQTKAVPRADEHAPTSSTLPKHGDVPRQDQAREDLIRPLDPQWEKEVNEAMGTEDHTAVLTTSCDGVDLTRRSLGKILPQRGTRDDQRGWLDDEGVNGWISEIVAARNAQAGYVKDKTVPKMASYSSAWYENYTNKGWKSMVRWSGRKGIKGDNLLAAEKVFFPVNTGVHWTLLVVSPKARTIEYLDSASHKRPTRWFDIAREWLEFELGDSYRAEEWKEVESKSTIQLNDNDCGVFTCMNALASAKGKPFADVPRVQFMPLARSMMVAVLLNKGFHGDWKL